MGMEYGFGTVDSKWFNQGTRIPIFKRAGTVVVEENQSSQTEGDQYKLK